MTNTNIKFQLVKFEKALAFQIHEQTESLNYSWYVYKDINNNIIEIDERRNVEISFKNYEEEIIRIFLRPKKKVYDNYISIFNTYNNEKTNECFNKILEALKEWSQYVYKITNREPQEPKEFENGIYEF